MADTYTVTQQTPVMDAQPGGQVQPAMEITFTTKPHQVIGKVRVPMSMYTREHVDDVLRAQAAILEDVQTL